jgi:hypothetical protein
MFAVATVDAEALAPSERPSPAAPRAGTAAALVKRFRFEACFTRDMQHSSMPVFRTERFYLCSACNGKILRLAHAPCKLERVHNWLLHPRVPFMSMNSAPLRHDQVCIHGGRRSTAISGTAGVV